MASYSQLQILIARGQLNTSLIVLAEQTKVSYYTFLIQLEIAELAIASCSQLQLVMASDQLMFSQTPSLIVHVEQTNIPYYTFLIRLEIAELAIASYSQLQLVVGSGQLVIKQTPSVIILFEQTNFPFDFCLLHHFNPTWSHNDCITSLSSS